MYYSQQVENNKRSGAEFLKIYAITLVAAFTLMAAVQQRACIEFDNFSKKEITAPETPAHPIADSDEILPLQKLKDLIINLSF